MRKIALGLTTLVVGFSPLALATSAEAANRTPGCATKAEFRKIKRDDSLSRVRSVIGHRGRLISSSNFSDGDGWKSYKFRQCGKAWRGSAIGVDFEKTEVEVYVPDVECYSDGECVDYGYYETQYRQPYVMTSKSAFWF